MSIYNIYINIKSLRTSTLPESCGVVGMIRALLGKLNSNLFGPMFIDEDEFAFAEEEPEEEEEDYF